MESCKGPNACLNSRHSPPDELTPWEVGHGRLERRRLKRLAVTPEQIGLCGCWQIIAVRRERIDLAGREDPSEEIGYYLTSASEDQYSEAELHEAIREHWSSIENGIHHRRDVSFGEDACRVAKRRAAHALAALRNLAIGVHEIERKRGHTTEGCKSWSRQLTCSRALALLR
jgi:predicted transposase YbfD/YdcC